MATKSINLHAALQDYFGFSSFKGNQEKIIRSLLSGKDTFVIMPTGGGKSLCYQLPAVLMDGVAIIISPLIALMKNQVDLVRNYSAKDDIAHFLNSSLTRGQRTAVIKDIKSGKTKMLYVAPETLTKQDTIDLFKEVKVSFIAVDEAHCISEWGHDFRPEYRRIKEIIHEIKQEFPIIALTATATPKVQSDILKTLELRKPDIYISSFNRPNLYYEVRPKKTPQLAIKNMVQFIKQRPGKSGIVYVINRKTADDLAEVLRANGIKAGSYHAGLDSKIRTQTQDAFLMEELDVIVATIAFGMGIDKPDIRFVIHYDMPKSLENYYQETGRSGRDGLDGECIVYFSYKDIGKLEKLLRDKTVAERERNIQLINESVAYIESAECRRKFLLHYFGEEFNEKDCGKMCDNCRHPKEKIDVTKETKTAIELVKAVKEKHDLPYLVKILLGKKVKELTDFKYDRSPFFGIGADKDEHFWNSVIRNAMMRGLLDKDIEKYGLIKLTSKSEAFLKKPTKVMVAVNHNFDDDGTDVVVETGGKAVLDPNLYKMLKELQQKIGRQNNLPPYVIFQDFSLEEMATRYPITMEELITINGVSKGKAERYGKPFIELIKKYVEENEIDRPTEFHVKTVASKGTEKIRIIQGIDKRIPIDELAKTLNMKRHDLISEIESIVNSGTKINLDYHLRERIDDELMGYIYEYLREHPTGSIDEMYEEFKNDDVDIDDLRLMRVKFISEMGN
ncbi:MAG: DNA helicase RecQ [Chitinophagales bacterium]|nr:DNA helicase RecQ [Chitinophagales bacterium]MDW8418674.1 DNA helicase RecQ [Chitinophagales bacterium]